MNRLEGAGLCRRRPTVGLPDPRDHQVAVKFVPLQEPADEHRVLGSGRESLVEQAEGGAVDDCGERQGSGGREGNCSLTRIHQSSPARRESSSTKVAIRSARGRPAAHNAIKAIQVWAGHAGRSNSLAWTHHPSALSVCTGR